MTELRALTVQQPWAWAIFHGKDVENRTQAWTYRGPVAIHAGKRWSTRGSRSGLIAGAYFDSRERTGWRVVDRAAAIARAMVHGLARFVLPEHFGAIIGVVDLADIHVAEPGCCESPWAEYSYDEHGGNTRRDIVHLVLEHPRALAEPIPCRGSLGLWVPPADVLEQLQAAA